jgi:peptide chain release factor subunit 1
LTEEISQSSNIKSPSTRKNVQGALRRITAFLKNIDFKIPERGLVVFCGNVSGEVGKSDIRVFTVRPLIDLKTKLYWCDSEFHLAPLKEMIKPTDIYGIVAIDKNEATIATIIGKKYEIIGHFSSGFSGKARAGGWSAKRFEHLREEATNEFYKRISEKVNNAFLPKVEKLKGLIVGGPGITKNYFLNKGLIDHRLKGRIIGTVDTSYTDESGIREIVQRSDKLLRETDLMKEKARINDFLEEIAKDGLAAYGEQDVNEALKLGKVSTALISEGIEWQVFKFRCGSCGSETELIDKGGRVKAGRCTKCNHETEIVEEIDYFDYMLEKVQATGAELHIISTETPEGEQFLKAFGGIGAVLRYK